MKFVEIIRESIETLSPSGYTGGKRDLEYLFHKNKLLRGAKSLPGDSGLEYNVIDHYGHPRIIIFDRKLLKETGEAVGKLVLTFNGMFPLQPAYQVDVITVHEDYRGMNIAKALYGIVLLPKSEGGLEATLLAGSSQTPAGRQNWLSLASISGVEVAGYLQLHDIPDGYIPDKEQLFQKIVDELYGKLGAQYIGKFESRYTQKHYFQFPVTVSKDKLENTVKNSIIKVYDTSLTWKQLLEKGELLDMIDTGLMARWVG